MLNKLTFPQHLVRASTAPPLITWVLSVFNIFADIIIIVLIFITLLNILIEHICMYYSSVCIFKFLCISLTSLHCFTFLRNVFYFALYNESMLFSSLKSFQDFHQVRMYVDFNLLMVSLIINIYFFACDCDCIAICVCV